MKKIIQLIGIQNSTFRLLEEQILTLFEQREKEVIFEEVVSVEEIMTFNLKTVPAIAVDGTVIYQQNGKKIVPKEVLTLLSAHL